MTKKDYILIAHAFKTIKNEIASDERLTDAMYHQQYFGINKLQQEITNLLEADNPRFDKNKFWIACDRDTQSNEDLHRNFKF